MELRDIMPLEAWERFEKALFNRFHINCTVYNVSGMSIVGKPNWCNRLCPEIKASKTALSAICAPGNQYFMREAQENRRPVIGKCDAGFIKVAVPIMVDGQMLGTAGGCGLLPEDGDVEEFIVRKTLGLTTDEIAERCRGVESMSTGEARAMAAFIEKQLARFVKAYEASPAAAVS